MNLFVNQVFITIFLVIIYIAIMLTFGHISQNTSIVILKNNYLNQQVMYQIMLFCLAIISMTITYFLNKNNFKLYFSVGNVSSKASELTLFGIKNGDSWLKTGLLLCLFISLGTASFMYFPLSQSQPNFTNFGFAFCWIILFSLTNSFAEEMIFRMGIVSPLTGIVEPKFIFLISAILFGLPHLAGMPSGIIGATMAGLLGYVLAKSMYETQGIFWAWLIHFLQDIIIFSVLYLCHRQVFD